MKTILALVLFGSMLFSNQPVTKSMLKKETQQRCDCYKSFVQAYDEVEDAIQGKATRTKEETMLPPGVQPGEYAYQYDVHTCLSEKRSSSENDAINNLSGEDRSSFETQVNKLVQKKCQREYKTVFGLK